MRKLRALSDIYAIDGVLLARAGELIDKRTTARIRRLSKRKRWKLFRVRETFLHKDFSKIFYEKRYKVIFSPPGTREELLGTVGNTDIEEGILRELRRMKRRDPYTYHHVLVVVGLTVKMAITLKRPRFNKHIAAHMSFAHDMGKTRIPAKILEKTTPLTKSEHETLQTHPTIGYVLLNYYCVKHREICSLSSLEHHERLNGSGYPRGIKELSKYTNLITPNDVLDALMTSRPYRRACYTLRQALDYLLDRVKKGYYNKTTVYTLISYARKSKPPIRSIRISKRKREKPPPDDIYGKIIE